MKRLLLLFLLFGVTTNTWSENTTMTLSLEECHKLALTNNRRLREMDYKQRAAAYEHKAAKTNYLPRISGAGVYLYTSKEISLLSEEQKSKLSSVGTAVGALVPELQGMAPQLNTFGSSLVDALHTDTHHAGVASILLTQPIYMGGKIKAYSKITDLAAQIAESKYGLTRQEIIEEVDETYWRIVALGQSKRLAEGYLRLVEKLDSDVSKMIAEGMATKADGLSVKVKVNEAHVAIIQVDNGIALSRMQLCELCGIPEESTITLIDERNESTTTDPQPVDVSLALALENRPELHMLSLASDLYKQKVIIARAEFLPNVALTGGYVATSPSMFNGFERKLKGMWSVGLMAKIPIATFGERKYKVMAAKAEASAAAEQLEDTRQKVVLQVSQCQQKVTEATERLTVAHKATEEADENVRYATLGHSEGVIPLSNVLEAQTAWLKAHSALVSAQVDLRIANVRLLKAVGQI